MTLVPERRLAALDFGTNNSVAALACSNGALPRLIALDGPAEVFRSALCFWQDDRAKKVRVGNRGEDRPSRLRPMTPEMKHWNADR